MNHLSAVAAVVTLLWAIWCVLSCRVQDGILGKLIFSCIAMSSLALLFAHSQPPGAQLTASLTLNLCFAAYSIRHAFMRCAWVVVLRRLICRDCPRRRAEDE